MINALENLGMKMLSRFVPAASASAGWCSCEPGHSWCCPERGYWSMCTCVQTNGTCRITVEKSTSCM